MEHGNKETKTVVVPPDKVLTLAEAQERIQGTAKTTAKQRKEEAKQKQEMNRQVTYGEFISQFQGFATQVDNSLLAYHENHVQPLQHSYRAVNNLAEVLVEALVRKGVITVDFLKDLQEEMLQDAIAKMEAAKTEASNQDKAETTTKEEQQNEQQSHHQGSR